MPLLATAGATVTGLDSDVERVLDLAGIVALRYQWHGPRPRV